MFATLILTLMTSAMTSASFAGDVTPQNWEGHYEAHCRSKYAESNRELHAVYVAATNSLYIREVRHVDGTQFEISFEKFEAINQGKKVHSSRTEDGCNTETIENKWDGETLKQKNVYLGSILCLPVSTSRMTSRMTLREISAGHLELVNKDADLDRVCDLTSQKN